MKPQNNSIEVAKNIDSIPQPQKTLIAPLLQSSRPQPVTKHLSKSNEKSFPSGQSHKFDLPSLDHRLDEGTTDGDMESFNLTHSHMTNNFMQGGLTASIAPQ